MNGAQERAQLEARSLVSENLQRGLLSAPLMIRWGPLRSHGAKF